MTRRWIRRGTGTLPACSSTSPPRADTTSSPRQPNAVVAPFKTQAGGEDHVYAIRPVRVE